MEDENGTMKWGDRNEELEMGSWEKGDRKREMEMVGFSILTS